MNIIDTLFPISYEASRARFIQDFKALSAKHAEARLESQPLQADPTLSIDYGWIEPPKKETLLIVSTAQHGIEGYVGSAMLKIFMDEFAPSIQFENTGLLLIHSINPWGMKNHRKVNENGVDLNRNFPIQGNFDTSINPDFKKLKRLLAPADPIHSFAIETLLFAGRTLKALIAEGVASLTHAALLGQYIDPKAMYYGGARYEEETSFLTNLFREALERYQTIIHLDMHSGYGPRYLMSIVTVPQELRSSVELSRQFNYPLILKGDRSEFYATAGDMTSYLYEIQAQEFPGKHVFACAFEFGTYGDSLLARVRSLRAMIFESQAYWHGARQQGTKEKVLHEFKELYFPAEQKWREKAIADCRQATDGILKAYQLL